MLYVKCVLFLGLSTRQELECQSFMWDADSWPLRMSQGSLAAQARRFPSVFVLTRFCAR